MEDTDITILKNKHWYSTICPKNMGSEQARHLYPLSC